MLGNFVAAEVTQRRSTHRRWIRLGPLEGTIQFLEVEVPVGVDPEEWPRTEEAYVIVSQERFASLDLALAACQDRGIETDAFDALWKTENPF